MSKSIIITTTKIKLNLDPTKKCRQADSFVITVLYAKCAIYIFVNQLILFTHYFPYEIHSGARELTGIASNQRVSFLCEFDSHRSGKAQDLYQYGPNFDFVISKLLVSIGSNMVDIS